MHLWSQQMQEQLYARQLLAGTNEDGPMTRAHLSSCNLLSREQRATRPSGEGIPCTPVWQRVKRSSPRHGTLKNALEARKKSENDRVDVSRIQLIWAFASATKGDVAMATAKTRVHELGAVPRICSR